MKNAWAMVPALVVLVACGSSGEKTGEGSAKPAASGASGSGSAKPEAPKNVDTKVVEELRKVGACERKDGRQAECAAADAWREYAKGYANDDDEKQSKAKKLAESCLSMIADGNDTIRELAADCVASGGLEGDKNAMGLVLAQLEAEKGEDARALLASAVDSIGVDKTGATDRVVGLLKKHQGDEKWLGATKHFLRAFANGSAEPPAGAYDVAVDLLKNGKGSFVKEEAADVVVKSKSKTADGCKVLLTFVESAKSPWAYGMDAMGQAGCKAESSGLVAAVVKKMGEEEGYDKGFLGADFIYLDRFLDKVELSKDDKDKLKKAAQELQKKTKNDHVKDDTKKLLAKLK